MAEKEQSTNNKKKLFLIVLALCIIVAAAAAAVFFYRRQSADEPTGSIIVDIPTVLASVVSESDGEPHNILVTVSLELQEDAPADSVVLASEITGALSEMDFDKLQNDRSFAYLKSSIEAGITDVVNADDVLGVYITDFYSGKLAPPVVKTD